MNELLGAMGGSEWDSIFQIAEGVQKSVESKQWAYLAVISVFLFIEINKRYLSGKIPAIKENAAQYSAGLSTAVGAALADDPVTGAMGGLMVGNAASGLYSLLKPFMRGDILALTSMVLKLSHLAYSKFKNTPSEKKKEALNSLNEAIKSSKGENASTKELEKWFSENR